MSEHSHRWDATVSHAALERAAEAYHHLSTIISNDSDLFPDLLDAYEQDVTEWLENTTEQILEVDPTMSRRHAELSALTLWDAGSDIVKLPLDR